MRDDERMDEARERAINQEAEEIYERLDHPGAPLAEALTQKPAWKTSDPDAAGGGGGPIGATMESRLEGPIHSMDAWQAADTGGVAIEPSELVPLTSAGDIRQLGTHIQDENILSQGGVAGPSPRDQGSTGELRSEAMQESVAPFDQIGPEQTVTADTPGYLGSSEP